MAQVTESIVNEDGIVIFSAEVDTAVPGCVVRSSLDWYSPNELVQVQSVLERMRQVLATQE